MKRTLCAFAVAASCFPVVALAGTISVEQCRDLDAMLAVYTEASVMSAQANHEATQAQFRALTEPGVMSTDPVLKQLLASQEAALKHIDKMKAVKGILAFRAACAADLGLN